MEIVNFFGLKDKVAIVTGASSGLGKRITHVLAQAGCQVIAATRRQDRLNAIFSQIEDAGGRTSAFPLDLSSKNSIQGLIKNIDESGKAIDVLVNNAGVAGLTHLIMYRLRTGIDSSMSTFEALGYLLLTSRIAQYMKAQGGGTKGSIINISSINGGQAPYPGTSAYCASKAGLIQMTKASLVSFGIRVNSILPGLFETDMTGAKIQEKRAVFEGKIPLSFIAEPSDIDGALLFLASNKASCYVIGTEIVVDGGISANCTMV